MKTMMAVIGLIVGLGFLSKATPPLETPTEPIVESALQTDSLRHLDTDCYLYDEDTNRHGILNMVIIPESELLVSMEDDELLELVNTELTAAIEAEPVVQKCSTLELHFDKNHVEEARNWSVVQYQPNFGWIYGKIITGENND